MLVEMKKGGMCEGMTEGGRRAFREGVTEEGGKRAFREGVTEEGGRRAFREGVTEEGRRRAFREDVTEEGGRRAFREDVTEEGGRRVIRVRTGEVEGEMKQFEMWDVDGGGSEIVNECLEMKMSLKLHQFYTLVLVAAFHSQRDLYQYWYVILLHR